MSGLLDLLPPETAHAVAIRALANGLPLAKGRNKGTETALFGKTIPNRIGLSGGADKNAEALSGWHRLGFGFVEAGTVTPEPRDGNPGPRVWRIGHDGMVNWMGLPNRGIETFVRNMVAFRASKGGQEACVGASVSSPTSDPDEMRELGIRLRGLADFLTLNASCPNTEHAKDALAGPLRELVGLRAGAGATPILVKLGPVDDERALATLVDGFLDAGASGFVACNTVPPALRALVGDMAPDPWPERDGTPVGGLSGPALLPLSQRMVSRIRARAGDGVTVIGVGGVSTGHDLSAMISAGADAVEVYTAVARGGAKALARLVEADASAPARSRTAATRMGEVA